MTPLPIDFSWFDLYLVELMYLELATNKVVRIKSDNLVKMIFFSVCWILI